MAAAAAAAAATPGPGKGNRPSASKVAPAPPATDAGWVAAGPPAGLDGRLSTHVPRAARTAAAAQRAPPTVGVPTVPVGKGAPPAAPSGGAAVPGGRGAATPPAAAGDSAVPARRRKGMAAAAGGRGGSRGGGGRGGGGRGGARPGALLPRGRGRDGGDANPAATAAAAAEAAARLASPTYNLASAPGDDLLMLFSDLCAGGRLRDALALVERAADARRPDVLRRLRHKHFLAAATAAASPEAAALALRFVAALPRGSADQRTYTLAVSAAAAARCAACADAAAAAVRAAGVVPDGFLYTAIVSAYAAAGAVDDAFGVYADMRAAGIRSDGRTHCALVSACGRAMAALPPGPASRRTGLVLLERAAGVVDDMQAANMKPDAPVWNALIAAAGRAGALQRAFAALEAMKAGGERPGERTYAALIDGCARAGRADLAVRVYHTALRAGHGTSPLVYTCAVAACKGGTGGGEASGGGVLPAAWADPPAMAAVAGAPPPAAAATAAPPSGPGASPSSPNKPDLPTALEIYGDATRNGVPADPVLYASLISVAGAARARPVLVSLAADAEADGFGCAPEVTSAAVAAAVEAGDLDAARAALSAAVRGESVAAALAGSGSAGAAAAAAAAPPPSSSPPAPPRPPAARAFNAVINACGVARRLPDAVATLQDMAGAGVPPDSYTFAALLNGLQRAGSAHAAFDVYRVMRARGGAVDEALCFILVRLCYNGARAAWFPGGYPPGKGVAGGGGCGGGGGGGSGGWGPDDVRLRATLLSALGVPPAPAGVGGRGRGGRGGSGGGGGGGGGGAAALPSPLPPTSDDEPDWAARAVGVYRDALACGVRPSLRLLDRVLACLRLPQDLHGDSGGGSQQPGGGGDPANQQHRLRGPHRRVFDARALPILDDAIVAGVLPAVSLPAPAPKVDLRGLPPAVAEVYVLAVVGALQRAADGPRALPDVTLLVPPYDPADVFYPSYARDSNERSGRGRQRGGGGSGGAGTAGGRSVAAATAAAAVVIASGPASAWAPPPPTFAALRSVTSSSSSSDEEEEDEAGVAAAGAGGLAPTAAAAADRHNTGLGVAAMLRRIGLWAVEAPADGLIRLQAREVTRWVRAAAAAGGGIGARPAGAVVGDGTGAGFGLSPSRGGMVKGGGGAGPSVGGRLAAQAKHIRAAGLDGGEDGKGGGGGGGGQAPPAWWEELV